MPLYVNESEVAELLLPADAVAAVEGALARLGRGAVDDRPRQRVPVDGGVFAVMHAVDRELGLAAVKSYAWIGDGASFAVLLFSLASGEVEAVLEADVLGRLRTGGASGAAARLLARPGARTLGVVGCGRQAETQIACIRAAVPSIAEVLVHCRDRARLVEFAARAGAEPAESPRDCGACDVVVTVTTARDPVLRGEWLRPGALVIGVGANEPTARELDNVVLERATLVCVDSRELARREAGDLVEPVAQGVLDWLEVVELHAVASGEEPGRQADDDVVLFKSSGIATWDLAAAAVVVERARERGAGRVL